MHPFPPASDLQFLIGQDVTQICLGRWDLQFRFTNGGSIAIQSDVLLIHAEGAEQLIDFELPPVVPPYLCDFLHTPIIGFDVEPFTLAITFENGSRLKISSDEGMYECGQIYPSSDQCVMVVF